MPAKDDVVVSLHPDPLLLLHHFLGLYSWFSAPYSPSNSVNFHEDIPNAPYVPPRPRVEQYLVTLSSIDVNKSSTGRGSPWSTVVEGPVTFDLAALGREGSPQFLGDAVAEPGSYRIIRMRMDQVLLKFEGQEALVEAKITKPFIQLVERFEVFEGLKTRLFLDFDATKSLVETPPGSGKFNFKPTVKLVVLEEGVPLAQRSVALGPLVEDPGAIELSVGDSSVITDLSGTVRLEGRGGANQIGTEITFFQNGVRIEPGTSTLTDGSFFSTLSPGWLSDALEFVIGGDGLPVDLGTVTLLAGDADADEDIDSEDLDLFQAFNEAPPPDVHSDFNGDGRTGLFDLALAGKNFGRKATPICAPAASGDPDGPTLLSVGTSLHPSNSLIVDFDITTDSPSRVYIEYESEGVGRVRSQMTKTLSTDHSPSVVRLRPLTTYCFEVVATDDLGRVSGGKKGRFTTGPLPEGLRDATFDVIQGHPTYPLTLMERNDADFNGIVALDSDAEVIWYYQSLAGNVSAIAQKENGNLVYIASRYGLREIDPLGTLVNRLDEPCTVDNNISHGRWYHDVLLMPDNKVLFLGTEVHDTTDIFPDHGPQLSDTIEEWDQVAGTGRRLFDEFDFIPVTDRTSPSSDNSDAASGFFWNGCPEVETSDDWTHSNSIFVGPSGNVVVSIRNLNQIIAIAPDFGSLVWRLGGPGGEFTFPDPSDRFYHQHSAKELLNGNILLFDNGNRRPAEEGGVYSRALELSIDTNTMTATKEWEYRHAPDLQALCCSNVTRLGNDNTVAVFGADFFTDVCCRVFTLVEADPQGNTVWEVQMTSPGQQIQYRVYPIDNILGESSR